VTAQFNKNLLVRINRELEADFDLNRWQHHAIYSPTEGRIEIYLISDNEQTVHIGAREFNFAPAKKFSPNTPTNTPSPDLSSSRARLAFISSKCGPTMHAGLAFSISPFCRTGSLIPAAVNDHGYK